MLLLKPYRIWRIFSGLAVLCLLVPAIAAASSNSGITYHGRILNPGGIPLSDSNVQFKMQILTPDSQDCVMYEEIQSKDLSSSGGAFSITINDGTGVQTFYGYTLDQILGNYGTFHLSPAVCSTGTGTWTPNVSDGRSFVVSFKSSSMATWEPLPSQNINFAPFAIEAKQVTGFPGGTLLRVEDATTGPSAIRSLTPTEATELLNVVDGTSSKYIQSTSKGAPIPGLASNPTSPAPGDLWYDSTNNQLKYYDGTTVQTLGGSSGTAITSGTIGGSTAVNTSGNIQTSGNVVSTNVSSTTDSTTALKVYESTVTNAVTITAPASLVAGGYGLVLPNNKASAAGQVLSSDTSGNLSWTSLGSGTTGFFQNGGNSFGAAAVLGTNDLNSLAFKTNNTTAMTISTAGNVGIGTTPTYLLDIQKNQNANTVAQVSNTNAGASAAASYLLYNGTDATGLVLAGTGAGRYTQLYTNGPGNMIYDILNASGDHVFRTTASATERMRITSAGNVGIGTPSPGAQLSVSGAGQTTGNFATAGSLAGAIDVDDTGAAAGNGGTVLFSANSQAWKFAAIKGYVTNGANNSQGDIVFATRPIATTAALTEAMRIQASGNVGIGTSAPSYSLDVTGNVRATVAMYATGFFYTSDQRLKENIQTIENPIDKIVALRGVNFQWKETKQQDMGFIAQEVEQVLPEVMGTRPDKTYGEIKTVKYANIVALAVEAIKDLYSKWQGDHRDLASLKAEVDQLKSDNNLKNQQIEALEKRLEKLESQKN